MAALIWPAQTGVRRWWPFVLLLLAGAARWMLIAAHPEANSTLSSEALGCAWAALLSFALFDRKGVRPHAQPVPESSRLRSEHLRCLLAGAMLFGGPAVALLIRGRELDAGALTIALTLTPVVIAIAASSLGSERADGIAGRIWPGLAAAAGLLLLLVQPALGDARSDLALILAPALTGIGAALFCADQPSSTSCITAALLGASALFALSLTETYFVSGVLPTISLLAVACDGLLALLGIISLAQLGATRWSSQFTWIPLLIVFEGILLVRPPLTAHWIIGLGLLVLASVYLLLPQESQMSAETFTAPG